jgi:hypothetical protein
MNATLKVAIIGLGAVLLAACNPFPNAQQQDPEVAQGQKDALSGKYGKETQNMAKEFESMKNMSPEDQLKRLKELERQSGGQ